MIKKIKFPKIFFGWWTVLANGLLSLWVSGYQVYGISALFKPISLELGFSRVATSIAASIGNLEGGVEGPLAGWITDKYGPRLVVTFGIFLCGLSLILMNFTNSLWAYYVVWGVILGTGHNISTTIPADTAISNWFVKKRGLAFGIKWGLSGFSGVLVLPLIAWLIITQGWRMACVIGGVVMLFVGLPLTWFCFKRHRPEYYGLLPDGATVEKEAVEASQTIEKGVKYAAEIGEVEYTLRQALRAPAFWLLILAQATHSLIMPVISIHSIPFLTDIGIDPFKAASMVAMLIFIGLPLRVVGGFLADRVKKYHFRFLIGGAYFLETVGIAVFLLNQTLPMIYVWFIIYGIGNGLAYGLISPMWARYFGRKAFASIRGIGTMFMTPVKIVAPIYAGWVYDTTGSYITVFTASAVALAFSTVLMSLVIPPKPPAQISDIHKIL